MMDDTGRRYFSRGTIVVHESRIKNELDQYRLDLKKEKIEGDVFENLVRKKACDLREKYTKYTNGGRGKC